MSSIPGVPGVESVLTGRWWAVTLRGALNVLFGLIALLWPGITFVALVLLFGAYAFADGVVALVAAVRARAVGPGAGRSCWRASSAPAWVW